MPPSTSAITVASRRVGRRRRLRRCPRRSARAVRFGHLADGARRQHDAVMLLEFPGRLCERQIRPQIRHHPLQRQRAAPVLHLGTLDKRTPPSPGPSRYCGSSTSMSPKVLCQRSFFALPPNPRRPSSNSSARLATCPSAHPSNSSWPSRRTSSITRRSASSALRSSSPTSSTRSTRRSTRPRNCGCLLQAGPSGASSSGGQRSAPYAVVDLQ